MPRQSRGGESTLVGAQAPDQGQQLIQVDGLLDGPGAAVGPGPLPVYKTDARGDDDGDGEPWRATRDLDGIENLEFPIRADHTIIPGD